MKVAVATPEAMEELGSRCAQHCGPGCRIFLRGSLGAGKTTFVRGFVRGLGHQGKVKSPTYTLVEPYELSKFPVYHFDLYRLGEALELEAIGARDYFDGSGVCLVEWPERAGEYLGEPDIGVAIEITRDGREVSFKAGSERGRQILRELSKAG